ncbi:RHS repeat protein [Pasteurella testudinis]|nr:Cell wall-associated polypeptide CWBP200 [Pasteurella testudinis]
MVWQLRYGAFDLLSEKIDGEGNRWRYDYDKDSLKLNQVTNPLGETYTYTFNADGLVETETDFADNRWTFRYDENGNLLHLTNGEGEQTDYHYDDNGRLLLLRCGADSVHYQYDKVGRVRRIDTVDSCLQYRYDDLDRIVEERQGRQRITREYDDEQQTVTRHLWIDGKDRPISTTFKYNKIGELIALQLPATDRQPHQLHFRYDQDGNETERTANQGFILKQRYNSMGLPLQQRAGYEPQHFFNRDELRATGIESPSFAQIDKHYRYDKALNTIGTQDKQQRLSFSLNRNNQITEVVERDRLQERYAYDANGYLNKQDIGLPSYGLISDPFSARYHEQIQVGNPDLYQKGNRLQRIGDTQYTYDNAGRLTHKSEFKHGYRQRETRYQWNGANQLTCLSLPNGQTWYYKYDALGRRIEKACRERQTKVRYVWDGDQLYFINLEL